MLCKESLLCANCYTPHDKKSLKLFEERGENLPCKECGSVDITYYATKNTPLSYRENPSL